MAGRGITVAADGSVYFTEFNTGKIGRLDPVAGTIVEFALPTGTGAPFGITTDIKGNIWFTELNANRIGTLIVPAPHSRRSRWRSWARPASRSPTSPSPEFSDPSGNDPVGNYTATIDWGDGTTTTGVVSLNGGSFVVSGTHTYANPGNFTAKTTISNTVNGRTVQVNSPATILSGPINPIPGTINASAGTPILDVALATFNGSDPASSYTVTVNWGDGSALGGAGSSAPRPRASRSSAATSSPRRELHRLGDDPRRLGA